MRFASSILQLVNCAPAQLAQMAAAAETLHDKLDIDLVDRSSAYKDLALILGKLRTICCSTTMFKSSFAACAASNHQFSILHQDDIPRLRTLHGKLPHGARLPLSPCNLSYRSNSARS